MINAFTQIDHLASAGTSPWHRASAIAKLLLVLLHLVLALVVPSWVALAALFLTALVLCATARVPRRLMLAAATTPLLFSVIFVAAHYHGDVVEAARLLLRPMVVSLSAVWLVSTTPYPDLFAPLSRLLPQRVGDSLFLTYRAVFVLLERVERLWKALRLRGAMARPVRERVAVVGEALGTVVLSGFDRSVRLYQVMHLRGHSGRICGCRHYLDLTRADRWVLVAALWSTALCAVLWRAGGA